VLGLLAARQGQRAIIVEVNARGDVPRMFGRSCEAGVETELQPGLWTLAVDPRAALEEYLRDQLPGRMLADVLASGGAFGYVAAATPGLRELLTIGKIWELAQEARRPPGARPYDVVIVDAPATGHGLALLEAPRTFSSAAQIGPIARQGAIIAATLDDRSQTAMAAVATPEQAAVDELLELRRRLGDGRCAVFANAVTPVRFTDADAAALSDAQDRLAADSGPARPDRGVRGALAVALAEHDRVREQRAQLDRLEQFVELPLISAAELAQPELEVLVDLLAAAPA